MLKKLPIFAGILVIIFALSLFTVNSYYPLDQTLSSLSRKTNQPEPFPEIKQDDLTDTQKSLVRILRDEYKSQSPGTKYADGTVEPWCADFASWAFLEAGAPYENPNSGSWRIPGTFTLKEYYQSIDKFIPIGSSYQPKLGDVMIYNNPSSFGQHVNIVLTVDGDNITTIGGNENNKIRILTHQGQLKPGFVGYGVL